MTLNHKIKIFVFKFNLKLKYIWSIDIHKFTISYCNISYYSKNWSQHISQYPIFLFLTSWKHFWKQIKSYGCQESCLLVVKLLRKLILIWKFNIIYLLLHILHYSNFNIISTMKDYEISKIYLKIEMKIVIIWPILVFGY